jgi:hypothetical protein
VTAKVVTGMAYMRTLLSGVILVFTSLQKIPYGYLGMESSCKSQGLDSAPVTKKAETHQH